MYQRPYEAMAPTINGLACREPCLLCAILHDSNALCDGIMLPVCTHRVVPRRATERRSAPGAMVSGQASFSDAMSHRAVNSVFRRMQSRLTVPSTHHAGMPDQRSTGTIDSFYAPTNQRSPGSGRTSVSGRWRTASELSQRHRKGRNPFAPWQLQGGR